MADSDDDDNEVGFLTQASNWVKGTFDSVKSSGWTVCGGGAPASPRSARLPAKSSATCARHAARQQALQATRATRAHRPHAHRLSFSTSLALRALLARASQVAKFGGTATWVIASTVVITLLPLVLEVEREQSFEQMQALQVAQMKEQGYTEQQLRQMGLVSDAPTEATLLADGDATPGL